MKKIKTAKNISAVLFFVSLFCTIDLGLNFLYNTETKLHDGSLSTYSILQSIFSIFGDSAWTFERFFHAFETSIWITFILLIINVIIRSLKNKE